MVEQIPAGCQVSFPCPGASSIQWEGCSRRGEWMLPTLLPCEGGAKWTQTSARMTQAQRLVALFSMPLWGSNNHGSHTSFTLLTPNNSPLFIRPTTVNSKYLLFPVDEYRPNMVAVLFGCSLNVESKNTSFSVGSPSACCRKFVTTLLLEYERRSITEK